MQDSQITATRKKMSVLIALDKQDDLKKLLIDLGNDARTVLNKPATGSILPLINACDWGSPETIKLYLDFGADVNAKTAEDETPLDQVFYYLELAPDLKTASNRMQCAKLMLLNNVENSKHLQHMNLFLLFLLRLRRIGPTAGKLNLNYYSLWMETIEDLAQTLQEIYAHGGEQFTDYAEEIVRSKHILGLDMDASIHIQNLHSDLQPGNQTVFSQYYLHECLAEYLATVKLPAPVHEKFHDILEALEQNNSDIKIIPTGWLQHDLYVAKVGNKLILCNRGETNSDDWGGVKIFELKDLKTDVAESLRFIETAAEFEDKLQGIVEASKPAQTFDEIKEQKHGTCSFVNVKSLIAPLLHILGDAEYYDHYKQFTTWIRDRELEHLLAKFNQARLTRHKADRLFYFEILMKYAIKLQFMQLMKGSDQKLLQDEARLELIKTAFADFDLGKTFVAWLDQAKPKELEKEYFVPLKVNGSGRKPVGNISVKYAARIGDLNFTKLHCEDQELHDYILANIRQRKIDIALQIDAAKHIQDKSERAAAEAQINHNISALQTDWEKFLHAAGQAQLIEVSQAYVEERKKLLVVSSIFSISDENVVLDNLDHLLKLRLNG